MDKLSAQGRRSQANCFKKLLAKLRYPTKTAIAITLILLILTVSGVICSLVYGAPMPLPYFIYALAAIVFGYFVYIVILLCIKFKPRASEWASRYAFTSRFVGDYAFRTMIFTAVGFIVNVGFAAVNGAIGITYGSLWFCALAVYYIVLGFTRGIIVSRTRKVNADDDLSEKGRAVEKMRIYLAAGILMLVLSVSLNIVMWVMVHFPDAGFRYEGVLIYVAAAFTVYKMAMAVHNLIRVRGSDDYAVKAVRNINFAVALVSVLALQAAMIAAFDDGLYPVWANAGLGTAICVFAIITGIYMIVKAVRSLKRGEECVGECTATDQTEWE